MSKTTLFSQNEWRNGFVHTGIRKRNRLTFDNPSTFDNGEIIYMYSKVMKATSESIHSDRHILLSMTFLHSRKRIKLDTVHCPCNL
jgi:hypothetical protein